MKVEMRVGKKPAEYLVTQIEELRRPLPSPRGGDVLRIAVLPLSAAAFAICDVPRFKVS